MVLMVLFTVWSVASGAANAIDSLITKADVQKFLMQHVDSYFKKHPAFADADRNFRYTNVDSISKNKKFPKPCFLKGDIDGNGQTDLVVNGANLFVVLSLDTGYIIKTIDRGTFLSETYWLADTINDGQLMIKIGKPIWNRRQIDNDRFAYDSLSMQYSILLYKYGGFVEYNPKPIDYGIDSITIKTGYCFGSCPVFEMTINNKRQVFYNAINYNKQTGKYKGSINNSKFDTLIDLVNYTDFPSLKDSYEVDWTDDQTATLTIYYNQGAKKEITDYGEIGTFGLERIYNMFFAMRGQIDWHK